MLCMNVPFPLLIKNEQRCYSYQTGRFEAALSSLEGIK